MHPENSMKPKMIASIMKCILERQHLYYNAVQSTPINENEEPNDPISGFSNGEKAFSKSDGTISMIVAARVIARV